MILGTGAKREQAYVRICRNGALLFILLLCLCVSSWAACYSATSGSGCYRPEIVLGYYKGCWNFEPTTYTDCGRDVSIPSITTGNYGVKCVWGPLQTLEPTSCDGTNLACGFDNNCCGGPGTSQWAAGAKTATRYLQYICDTQAEADSVKCELDPTAEGCANACTEYQNECESHGGSWQGSVTSDTTCASTCDLCGTPESQAMREYIYNSCCEGGLTPQYSCGFPGLPSSISGMVYSDVLSMGCNTANWETQEICDAFYEESSSSQSSSSSTAQSSSSTSEYCLLFPNDLACICAEDSTRPECDYLKSSSSQAEPGSSGGGGDTSSDSGGGGTPSSSGSGGVAGDDWEYDYRDSLHRIVNATTRTATNTQAIKENTNGIWNLLKNAKCLFTDCTDYDQLKVALDSSIVIPDGDTAGVIGSMEAIWDSTAMADFMRGAENGDIYGINGDSVNQALGELGDMVGTAFGDTGGITGEMAGYKDLIEENFPTSQWSYTNVCPTALTSDVKFNVPPIGEVSAGRGLGDFFCGTLPPFNFSLGNMVRAVIRLALTIFMAIGIFRTATGFKDE